MVVGQGCGHRVKVGPVLLLECGPQFKAGHVPHLECGLLDKAVRAHLLLVLVLIRQLMFRCQMESLLSLHLGAVHQD